MRQVSPGNPSETMTVQIQNSVVSTGTAGVIFDNDGGLLNVDEVQISGVTSAALIATANAGTSFLQGSTVTTSNLDSVTFTTAGGAQSVINSDVRRMNFVEDVFYAEGTGSTLDITDTLIQMNELETGAFTGMSLQAGALGSMTGSVISDNTAIEFGVVASASQVSVTESIFSRNIGAVSVAWSSHLHRNTVSLLSNQAVFQQDPLNMTSAPVLAIADAQVSLSRVELNANNAFSVGSSFEP